MAALLRRRVALLIVLVVGALALPSLALADGRDILVDFADNGQIDRCYSRDELDEALRLVRSDQRQYGAAAEVVQDAQITSLKRPGEPCGNVATATVQTTAADDSGSGLGLWIGVAVAVGVVAAGAGAWARRGAPDDDG